MSPSDIELAARRMLNATGASFWSSDEIIKNYLYFAALELATETYCIENRYTTTGVDSQQEYVLASRAIAIQRVTYDSLKLKFITRVQLDSIDRTNQTTTEGNPRYYYYFDDALGLYPIPAESGKTIKIHSYDEPDVPTSTSTLEIPTQFHQYLVIGTAYYMAMKELGHPNVERYGFLWNSPANRNNAITKVRRSMRMRNKDQLLQVVRSENQPTTVLGMV